MTQTEEKERALALPEDISLMPGQASRLRWKYPLRKQFQSVNREIALRERVYPGLVKQGRLKQADATREIETMKAVKETLGHLYEMIHETPLGS